MSRPILAIRLRALGDVVLTTPALRALARGHPGRPLDVVTDPRYVDLVEPLPEVRRVWALERTRGLPLGLVSALRRERYSLVVDFFGNPRSAFLTAAAGGHLTAGYDLRGRRYAYNVRVARQPAPPAPPREYAAQTHVRLACAVGGVSDGLDPRLVASESARHAAEQVLARASIHDPGVTIGLVAAGTWGTKTWPVAHAAVLARAIVASGRPVLVLGGPGEERVTSVLERFAPGIAVLPPCGVATLVAVIARLGAVVGTDSGPRHVATAFGVPTFAWFGPTHPDNWTLPVARHATWWTDLPCRACGRTTCPHWNCMPGLDPETAVERVLAHLDRHVPTPDLRPSAGA